MGNVRRNTQSDAGLIETSPLIRKDLASEDFEPVSSQKFESPKEKKQLSSHSFKCSCEPSSQPHACSSAYRWLMMANGGRKVEL